MTTVIIIALIWAIYKLCSSASASTKERRAEQERERIREEQAQIKEEQRRQKEWAKAETARRIAIEREQIRQRQEQERQAKTIADHEERIAKAEQTIKQTTADIDFLRDRIAQLDTLLDLEKLEQAGAIPGSKTDIKCQKKIMTLENQIHTAEMRMSKAQFARQNAQRKLTA
jgi:chromosome segregation ATPase